MLPVMIVAVDYFRRMARRTYRQIRERVALINGYLQEAITGMAVVQLSAREGPAFEEFRIFNASHRDAYQLANKLEAALFSIVEAAMAVSIALLLLRGAGLHATGAIELGTIVAFIQYIQQFFVPIRDFSQKYAVMQSAMTAAERIFGLLDLEPEPVPAVARTPAVVRGAIEFDHVWFAYRGADWVLRDVSFTNTPG
jgi:ABC-type multidrug transport system fused ATPase/permease subunit